MQIGERLRQLRRRLGITTREVEEYSRRVADAEGNEEYYVSNAWITQLENKTSVPSIYKLYSLSVIYRIRFTDLLMLYGIDLSKVPIVETLDTSDDHITAEVEVRTDNQLITLPVTFDSGFRPNQTTIVSKIREIWGELPVTILQYLDFKNTSYGFIGLNDYTMYPLLHPGSFVLIDERYKKIQKARWNNPFERPIYFLELHDGYACSWCELQDKRLTLIPHQLSNAKTRQFLYPEEVEVLGQVTGTMMRIVNQSYSSARTTASEEERPLVAKRV